MEKLTFTFVYGITRVWTLDISMHWRTASFDLVLNTTTTATAAAAAAAAAATTTTTTTTPV